MPDAIVPTAPVLGHVEAVQLMQTGLWPASTGPFEVTTAKIAAAIEALDCTAVRRPILKLGHTGASGSIGDPAIGWVDNLRTDNEGQTLVGDFRGMPGWLTEVDDDGVSILAAAYPDRSIEGDHNYRCTKGHTHPFVVTAVSLLGVEQPAIGTLESLIDLYGVAAQAPGPGGVHVQLTTTGGAMPKQVNAAATTDDVRRAFYDGPGQNWELWIREMYVDPPELIVNNDDTGGISRLAYSIDSKGVVTFGELEPVKVQYVAARASAGDRADTWASKAVSREGMPTVASAPKTPAGVPPAGAPTPSGEEPAVAFSDEQIINLRKLAGVAADADEATILAALDQAVGEASPDPAPITPAAPATPAPAVAAAAGRIPEGAVVIDAATLQMLQEQGKQGVAAAKRLASDDRDRAIDAAVEAGKFPPASRGAWATAWDRDPEGTKAALASMPKNLVPVEHVGVGGDPDGPDIDAEFAAIFPPTGKAV